MASKEVVDPAPNLLDDSSCLAKVLNLEGFPDNVFFESGTNRIKANKVSRHNFQVTLLPAKERSSRRDAAPWL